MSFFRNVEILDSIKAGAQWIDIIPRVLKSQADLLGADALKRAARLVDPLYGEWRKPSALWAGRMAGLWQISDDAWFEIQFSGAVQGGAEGGPESGRARPCGGGAVPDLARPCWLFSEIRTLPSHHVFRPSLHMPGSRVDAAMYARSWAGGGRKAIHISDLKRDAGLDFRLTGVGQGSERLRMGRSRDGLAYL